MYIMLDCVHTCSGSHSFALAFTPPKVDRIRSGRRSVMRPHWFRNTEGDTPHQVFRSDVKVITCALIACHVLMSAAPHNSRDMWNATKDGRVDGFTSSTKTFSYQWTDTPMHYVHDGQR